MNHPILRHLRSLYVYAFVWAIISAIHALLLMLTLKDRALVSSGRAGALDAVVFNFGFAAIGISIWYVCQYNPLEGGRQIRLIANHVIAALLLTGAWASACYAILKGLLNMDRVYLDFLRHSIPWRFVIGMLFYLVLASFYYMYIYASNLRNQQLREAELQTLVREAQLRTLRFQINPHFIFNSLNSINSLTITNPARAGEMTIKLGDYLRYTLSKNEKQKAPMREELASARLYLDIEKVRFGEKINYLENIEETCLDIEVPSMILQPLIENAVKYGVYESLETVAIRVSCATEGDYVRVRVENEFDPESITTSGEGIGLRNISDRLEHIYDQRNLLTVEKNERLFRVSLLIPKQI